MECQWPRLESSGGEEGINNGLRSKYKSDYLQKLSKNDTFRKILLFGKSIINKRLGGAPRFMGPHISSHRNILCLPIFRYCVQPAKKDFNVQSNWFEGKCSLTTYQIEELLGTKIRALYQRRKGRDLYNLYQAFTKAKLDVETMLHCYRRYMELNVGYVPSQREFIQNMELKLQDDYFVGDIVALIRPDEVYDYQTAYELVKKELFDKM